MLLPRLQAQRMFPLSLKHQCLRLLRLPPVVLIERLGLEIVFLPTQSLRHPPAAPHNPLHLLPPLLGALGLLLQSQIRPP